MKTEKERLEYNLYMRRYNLARYHRLRNEAVVKLGSKCIKCNSTKDLELDHIDPKSKSMEIGRMLNSTLSNFWDEVDKCQLLCKSCHSTKSIIDRGYEIAKGTHGTLSSYRYCKCELCRKAKAEYFQIYKRRKKSMPL